MSRKLPMLSTAGLLACIVAATLPAQRIAQPRPLPPDISLIKFRDPVNLDPKHYSVDFENDQVRVLRVKLGRDETAPMHDARSGLLIAVTEIHVRFIRFDKRVHYVDLDPGRLQWIYEDSYSDKNVSDKPAEFLFVEMKEPAR